MGGDPQARQQLLSRFAQQQRVHAVVWAAWLAAQTSPPHATAQLLAELGPTAFRTCRANAGTFARCVHWQRRTR